MSLVHIIGPEAIDVCNTVMNVPGQLLGKGMGGLTSLPDRVVITGWAGLVGSTCAAVSGSWTSIVSGSGPASGGGGADGGSLVGKAWPC